MMKRIKMLMTVIVALALCSCASSDVARWTEAISQAHSYLDKVEDVTEVITITVTK